MKLVTNVAHLAAAVLLISQPVVAWKGEKQFAKAFANQKRALESQNIARHTEPNLPKRSEDLFLNDKTKPFAVDGKNFPLVPFDIGESYAGTLPISSSPNETREYFFWFFPTKNPAGYNDTTIWLNGGMGCSDLGGFLIENGPFTWDFGTLGPTQNPYTWVNLTNMLWVAQPAGAGYTKGTTNITNDYELGDSFIGFYKNFVDLFGLHDRKTYISGESYGGYYVPYIANAFIEANDTKYYDLGGIAVNDVAIGDETVQAGMTIKPFIDYWQNLFYLNDTTMHYLDRVHHDCGFQAYLDKYFKFPPPPGPFPVPENPERGGNASCDMFNIAANAITEVNPCFDFFHISDTCPILYTVLNSLLPSGYVPPGAMVYFEREDVKNALHAPPGSNCNHGDAYVGTGGDNDNDHTAGASQTGVLQRIIEHTNNVLIGSGGLDYLLNTDGLLLALQNVTWNGKQGFQRYPDYHNLLVPYHPESNNGSLTGSGKQGTWGHERGVTFYKAQLSGHKVPGNAPGVGYRAIELLTGRIANFSDHGDFTTQHGDFGNRGR